MHLNLKHLVYLLLPLFFFTQCKNKNQSASTSNLWEYRQYISSFSQNAISKQGTIEINLAQAIEGFEIGENLPNDILVIDPKVSGDAKLIDANTIAFQPQSDLQSDKLYSVRLNVNKLFPESGFDKPFVFQVKTIKPSFSVLIDALQTSETIEGEQEVLGHVESADVMTLEEAKKIVTAKQQGKNLIIAFDEAEAGKYFNFSIKGIKHLEESSNIEIAWNGQPINIDNKGNETIDLPGINDFKIVRFFVEEEPQQTLELNFSSELDKSQNIEGLIQLSGSDKDFDYSIDRNLLRIFPKTTLNGEIELTVNEGIKSVSGLTANQYANTITFKGAKPELRLLNSGTILPNSQGLKINFETISLRAVDVRVTKILEKNVLQFLQVNSLDGQNQLRRVGRPIVWKRILLDDKASGWKAYSLDLANLINTEPGAIYHVEFTFNRAYSTYGCAETLEPLQEETINYEGGKDSYWDGNRYYDSYGQSNNYVWKERDNPCHDAFYNGGRLKSLNVLASDLGLIAKKGDNGEILAVATDLVTADPEAGVLVKFYNYQMKELATATTNSDGFANYNGKEEVVFVEAAFNNHKAYLKFRDGLALPTSQFKTEGYTAKEGLKGLIYAERGIWRPGDDIFLSFILNDLDNPIPDNHPIKFELRDPEGAIIDEQVTTESINGFYSFATKTKEADKTGNYTAKVTVGNAGFYKSIPIEKIKPNRLKIDFDVVDNIAQLGAKWLHGANAGNLDARVNINLRSQKTTFEGFKEYTFDDPATRLNVDELNIFDGKLDDAGNARFNIEFEEELKAPGKLRATYITKVFEKGGSFSIDALSKDYSPYHSYVGVSVPETDNYYRQLDTDEDYEFNVVTVDEEGNPIVVGNLEVEVYKVNFKWWWNSSDENLSSYVSGSSRKPVFSSTITTNNKGRGSFKFGIDYPEWGRYLVRVKNPVSGHITGQTVYFDWPSWRGRSQAKNSSAANILEFNTDKESYKTGEKVKINFPSSEGGRALVSIESGSKVLDAFWVSPKDGFTKIEFETTKDMAPNVYINITYLQQHTNTKNDLPLRLYGVVPIEIYDAKTKLEPQIIMANELEPEELYKVKVKEKNGKALTYTLAVVDEGLLDLTRFKTPNAWDEFFQKQALGVKSYDVYDDVIGAYSGRIDQIFTIGGGDAAEAAGAKKAQRFKPVVTYLGPFDLNANETANHEIKMPYYVGSVRVMVVAGDNAANAYGSAEKAVAVKKPLMILGTLPRKISQNEIIDLPVSVFAMDKKVKDVSLNLSTNDLVEIVESDSQQLFFNETGEKEAAFQLRTTGKTGIATVEIIAKGGGETAKYQVEIDVTNPNERESKFTDFELAPNQSLNIPVNAISTNGSDEASLQLTTIPNLDFSNRIEELIRYPHGCAEQVTSSVFPQLYLSDISNTTKGQEREINKNVQDAIYRLKNYQSSDGGFQYWPGYSTSNDFVSTYVGHFLLEAKDKGYQIPFNMISNWKQYQNKVANKNYSSSSKYSRFRQAYRLYTLALAGDANLSAMNRLRETKGLSKETRWRLAAAYAIAGQQKTASKLIDAVKDDFNNYDHIYRYGSQLRNQSMALETAILLENKDISKSFANQIAKKISEDKWYSTQTTAYALYALSQYIQSMGGVGFNVQVESGNTTEVKSEKAIAIHELNPPTGNNSVNLKNLDNKTVYVRLSQSGIPPVGEETAISKGLSLEINYLDTEGKSIEIDNLDQASEFVAEIIVENLSKNYVEHIALTQIIPSGWEIINTRYTELGDNQPSRANYIDIRDDRVNYYFDLGRESSKTFQLQLNASFTGKYYLPGSIAEAMYNRDDYYVKQKGKWIEVVE